MDEEQTYRQWTKETLTEIKDQTIKTNGRVSKLEQWQSYVLGAVAAITILMLPIVYLVLEKHL